MYNPLIVPEAVSGNVVYGVRQVRYAVDGAHGKDFIDAVTTAAFKQSVAIEAAAVPRRSGRGRRYDMMQG